MYLLYFDEKYKERAGLLAERMNISVVGAAGKVPEAGMDGEAPGYDVSKLHLELSDEGLALKQGNLSMRGDFAELVPRIKKGRLDGEMQVKAARLKNYSKQGLPVLLDATAGMGEDSFILAAAGFRVILYEYDVLIASLLEDALLRAMDNPETAAIVSRMELRIGDSIAAMNGMDGEADVILLDPMFPARTKSAMVKKKFQLLQQLERPCANEEDLMQAAINANPGKIVIKRPVKGPWLAGMKPDYSMEGKAIRYDCIINVASRKKDK